MKLVSKTLKSSFFLATGAIQGGLAGLLSLILWRSDCAQVTIPSIEPNVEVDPDFSSINLNALIERGSESRPWDFSFNNQEFIRQLNNIEANVNAQIPRISPNIDLTECATSIWQGATIGLGVTGLGLGLYYAFKHKCRRKKTEDDNDMIELPEQDDSSSYSLTV